MHVRVLYGSQMREAHVLYFKTWYLGLHLVKDFSVASHSFTKVSEPSVGGPNGIFSFWNFWCSDVLMYPKILIFKFHHNRLSSFQDLCKKYDLQTDSLCLLPYSETIKKCVQNNVLWKFHHNRTNGSVDICKTKKKWRLHSLTITREMHGAME